MALIDLVAAQGVGSSVAVVIVALLTTAYLYAFRQTPIGKNAPKYTTDSWPIFGSLRFFSERWTFMQQQMAQSSTKNFSFHIGDKPVIALGSEEGRRVFFENKNMDFNAGYSTLLGGSPKVKGADDGQEDQMEPFFVKRLTALLKGNILAKGLPQLLQDVRARLDEVAGNGQDKMNPFDLFWRIIYQLTMRTVASKEIASDLSLLNKTLNLFLAIEDTGTAFTIMYPWLPLPASLRRQYAGAQLYLIIKNIMDDRIRTGRREDDALQYLMDQGDDVKKIIQFILGSLFAGQLNTGVFAPWVLAYLTKSPYWLKRVREEVVSVADRYCSDSTLPLKERLMHVPVHAWESEFPLIDLCLKDTIRLHMPGSAFRKNASNTSIPIDKEGKEVIPPGAFATFAVGDIHYNPDIYKNPDEWDPSRYMPDRAEDKKRQFGWIGWGVSRHPCLGMRFAKLEVSVSTAFFIAYFDDVELVDAKGNPAALPKINRNNHAARKVADQVYIKYNLRKD